MNNIVEKVKRHLLDACRIFGVDQSIVDVELMEMHGLGSIAFTQKKGNKYVIKISTDALTGYALLLNMYGYTNSLDRIVKHAVYHEVSHIRDFIDGVYDDRVYGLMPVFEVDFSRNLQVFLASIARDLYMFKRIEREFGIEFLKEIELYDFMRQTMEVFVESIKRSDVSLEVLHTILSYVSLEKIVKKQLSTRWQAYSRIVDLIDAVWKIPNVDWKIRSKHLSYLTMLLMDVDLEELIVYGRLRPFMGGGRFIRVLKDLAKKDPDIDKNYIKALLEFYNGYVLVKESNTVGFNLSLRS